jgi:glutathione S-transferase
VTVIDLYTWTTGNGRKVPIFLEETGTPYRMIMVDIHSCEQFKPEFVKINPNSKIPAMIDQARPGAPFPWQGVPRRIWRQALHRRGDEALEGDRPAARRIRPSRRQ